MKEDEKRIINLLKQGDNAAYQYLFDNHYALLCAVAFEFLKDYLLAQTIVDDLFFRLWEKRETIEITISLRSYLIRAVRNRCVNHLQLKRKKNEISFSFADYIEGQAILNSESFESPLGTLLEKELEENIAQAIENLPTESRKVFEMSRYDHKRYDQIAEELGISVNTVKYHIKRALRQLNIEIGKYLLLCSFCWTL